MKSYEATEVSVFLHEIGLPQYAEVIHENGFEDMDTLADIEEVHLKAWGIPPGHMLKLKKRLNEWKGQGDHGVKNITPPSLRVSASAKPTDRMITSVQLSWMHVKQLGTDVVGALFYKKVFELKPETQTLFPMSVRNRYRDWANDEEEREHDLNNSPALRRLWGKVIEAVGSCVAGLHDMNKLVPQLTQLGMRHAGYGLKMEYLYVAEQVLILTLKDALGQVFTKEVEFAWTMVYSFMTATMICGLRAMQSEIEKKHALLDVPRPETSPVITSVSPSRASSVAANSEHASETAQGLFVGQQIEGGQEVYRIDRHLQKAIFGDVYAAVGLSSGRSFALKVTDMERLRLQEKHQTLVEAPLNEIRYNEMVSGLENILQMEENFGSDDHHFVVSELAPGGDLMDALRLNGKGYHEDQGKLLVLDIAKGLASLHTRGLAMQDVSLDNMLLFPREDGSCQVRLCDPGQAVAFVTDPVTGQEKPVQFAGLVAEDFRPPELYDGQEYLATKVDSWCLGWNTFYLLTAQQLFTSTEPDIEKDADWSRVASGGISGLLKYKESCGCHLSSEAKEFVAQLMTIDPVKRMPIKDALWHPWLRSALEKQMLKT